MTDERHLIRRVQKRGDRAAADALVRAYYDEIFGFVRRQTPNENDAFDVTQEVFIGFLRTISGFDPRRVRLRTWLYRIAANKLVDCFRARSRRIAVEAPEIDEAAGSDEDGFAQRVADREFAERVSAFLGGEAPDAQRIFRLHVWGECSFAEIAEIAGAPEGTVKSKYYRLLAKLRKEFADYGQ
ncbi:MAG: RNA polymerase sigma factor [Clostridiales Family XIII bacterium]|nr:RNA polymerase sigma factor [Clostridiales Family XIII bacterium]